MKMEYITTLCQYNLKKRKKEIGIFFSVYFFKYGLLVLYIFV